MENFNRKRYQQATPIPAKFLLPDGTVVDTLPTSDGQGDIYSTEETVIGKWIDGKPIYRRVVVFSTPLVITSGQVTLSNFLNRNEEYFINCVIVGYREANDKQMILHTDVFKDTGTDITLASHYSQASADRYMEKLVLEYTKTTD